MRNMSSTATQVISTTKMAVAIAFCGAAMVAAAAAAGITSQKPDLIIRKMTYTAMDSGPGMSSPITIYYQNGGSAPVTQPFKLIITASPQTKFYYLPEPDLGSGTVLLPEYQKSGSGVYAVPLDVVGLQPGQVAVKKVWVANYTAPEKPAQLIVRAMIDAESAIDESNEKNNVSSLVIAKNDLSLTKDQAYLSPNGCQFGGYGYGYDNQKGCVPAGNQYGYNTYSPTYGYN